MLSNSKHAARRITIFVSIVVAIMGMGLLGWFPDNSLALMSPLYGFIMASALVMLGVCLLMLFSSERLPGKIEYSTISWFAMVFTTGMGIGLLNYAFQEAAMLQEYHDPGNPIGQVLNHWTLIPWGLYTAYLIFEVYDEKYDLTPKWFKTAKTYIYSVSMMLGIGISFALGVTTISGALQSIYGFVIPPYALVVLLASLVAVSVLRGMHKGLKLFSNITMGVFYGYIVLLMFQLKGNFLNTVNQGINSFITEFGYNNWFHGSALQIDWTVYYVVWFWSWMPFVVPFCLQISKGRSLRAVVACMLIAPSLLTTIFMMIGTSIGLDLYANGIPTSTLQYAAIGQTWYLPILFLFLMIAFYVTSSDSQSVALDNLISKGSSLKIMYRKIGWIFLEMTFVTVMLLAGSGTISAILGISLLFVPLLIIMGGYYIFLILKHYIGNSNIGNHEINRTILHP